MVGQDQRRTCRRLPADLANPDSDQFVYVIPGQSQTNCLDHAGLNDNPNAKIKVSATGSPRGALFNKEEVKIQYNATALKWCAANVNGQPVKSQAAARPFSMTGIVWRNMASPIKHGCLYCSGAPPVLATRSTIFLPP